MSINSVFQKQFRLKPMTKWDSHTFEEHLGLNVEWGVVSGRVLSGKSTVATAIAGYARGKVLDMRKIAEICKGRLGTEDEPFEGDVP